MQFYPKLMLTLALGISSSVTANTTTIYKFESKTGIPSFSDIAPVDISFKQIKVGCYACQLNSMVDWHHTKLYLSAFKSTILMQSVLHDVDPALIQAIIHAESHFNARAISKQGAQGLMQIMPETGQALGLKNAFNAKENIKAGTTYFAQLLRRFGGNITLACAAYNAGAGAVEKYNGVPPYKETQIYIERVSILHQRYRQETSTNS